MATKTFSAAWADGWSGLKINSPARRVRSRFTQEDWDSLKGAYIAEHGYTITIPAWDDIIKWKPTLLKTPAEIKAEKKRNLERVLASPSPDWVRSYSSVMTWIDNIQDTSSIIYPAFRMLTRWAPRIFARFIPIMGWALLAYDLLQLANTLGRSPLSPMKAKRAACGLIRSNPFAKTAQHSRIQRIKDWNPRYTDLLQAAQVTADWTGVGLSLGSIVGYFQDMAAGIVRTAMGEKVRIRTEPPPFNPRELHAIAAQKAAAWVSSAGRVFTEEVHFWTLATWSASTAMLTPWIEEYDLSLNLENPQQAIVTADSPTDPITIEVIREAGLSIEDGVRFPIIGEKFASVLDITNAQLDSSRSGTLGYYSRHVTDSYGFIASHLMDDAVLDLVDSLEPTADFTSDDTPMTHVFFRMLKAPIIPDPAPNKEQSRLMELWANDYVFRYEHPPKDRDITDFLNAHGIPYKTAYPDTLAPDIAAILGPAPDFSVYD